MPESDFIKTGQDSGIENLVKKLKQILVKNNRGRKQNSGRKLGWYSDGKS